MKILVVGGGTGGHVTPILAVVNEIWKKRPRAQVEFWTDKKYFKNVRRIAVENNMVFKTRKICAGKLRRYTNFTFISYLQNFDVVLKNIADFFRIIAGFWQSFWRLVFNRPDVIFLKGGYVCMPVGIVAHWLRIPYVIHDSDAAPGLTNRILSKHATKIATGMPLDYYNYQEERAEWTGIPVSDDFKPVTSARQCAYKKDLGFDAEKPLLVVTGGSQGAEDVNLAIREILPNLLHSTGVILIAGREHYQDMIDLKKYESWEDGKLVSNFCMLEFSSEMWKLFGAADIVVSRAGASTMTELSSMKKAVIMIPNKKLPGYHQVKNAEAYEKAGAAVVIQNAEIVKDPERLLKEVRNLLRNSDKRQNMAEKLAEFTKEDAAERIADIIISVAGNKK